MVHPKRNPDDASGIVTSGDDIIETIILPTLPDNLLVHLHHAVEAVDPVDIRDLITPLNPADGKANLPLLQGLVILKPQPIGMRRIKKKPLRRIAENDMRIC